MPLSNMLFLFMLFYTCFTKEQNVIQYTDENFSTNMAEHETALVMFYAPWCGHCKKLKPEFYKAARELAKSEPPIILAKVDCTESGKTICKTFDVSGYPTLKIFRSGEMLQEYSGPRDASGIIKYMRMEVGPSSEEFEDLISLESYLASVKEVTVVGFFKEESDLKEAFLVTANKLRQKAKFAYTSLENALEKYEVSDDIILVRPIHLRNKFEDDMVKYSGDTSFKGINDFILNNYHGLVGHHEESNSDDFKLPNIIAYYQVDYKKNPKGTNYWRNRILKVAQQYKDKITFAISSLEEMNEYDDVSFKDKPIVFARDSSNEKFKMEDDFSVESLENFVRKFLDKQLEPYVKSEAIPEANDEPVKIVVGKTFNELVITNEKDILIVFHSPWCGHCKKLMPVYDELAEKLQGEDIVIAKMDATANDVPLPFKIDGYPTIYWVPRDTKDRPVQYDDGRKLNDFIKYIAKHATNELKGYDRNGMSKKKIEL